ncbi:MAG: NUDIX hydrolase [Nanoarchaeota archaeon]|nr:NUDIX hydrolase [Nanoarchaeota archaeon]
MLISTQPTDIPNFSPKIHVSSIFVEREDTNKFLLLLQQPWKPQGGTWSVPAGKIEPTETPLESAIRELQEETGIQRNNLAYETVYYVRYPDYDFIYYTYITTLPQNFAIFLNKKEHATFTWATPQQALQHHLIPGEAYCIT